MRASKICSDKYLREEKDYLTDIFCENGHDRKILQKIINSFAKKTHGTNNNNNNNTNRKQTANLKDILCKNKDKLIPNSYAGVYELKCSCGSVYNGETKKKIISRSIEHQQESIKGNWSSSGATEHTKERHGHFDWLHPKTLHEK